MKGSTNKIKILKITRRLTASRTIALPRTFDFDVDTTSPKISLPIPSIYSLSVCKMHITDQNPQYTDIIRPGNHTSSEPLC